MTTLTLFDIFRRILLVIVSCYVTVQLVSFIWRWRSASRSADRTRRVLARYLELSVLRTKLRPFHSDLAQIAVLTIILAILVTWHH